MSFNVTLKIGYIEWYIVHFDYVLNRETDENGLPNSNAMGGKINLQIEPKNELFFFDWICNSFEKKDGSIVITKMDSDARFKEIFFKNAYLIRYLENYTADSPIAYYEMVTLSAEELIVGTTGIQNKW